MEGPPERPYEEVGRPYQGGGAPAGEEGRPGEPAPPPPRRMPFPYVTVLLILSNIAAHLMVAFQAGLSPMHSSLVGRAGPAANEAWMGALKVLGMKDNELISQGQHWRLVAAAFLHGGIVHLGCNMIGLWNLGQFIEMVYGARRFLFIYMGAAVAGIFGSFLGTEMDAVGASGAIFGLLGAGLVFSLRYRNAIAKGLGMSLFRQLLFWTVIFLGIGFAVEVVDNAGHIGGLLGGGALALLVSSRFAPPSLLESRFSWAAFLLSVVVLVFGLGSMVMSGFTGRLVNLDTGEVTSLLRWENRDAGYSLRLPLSWTGGARDPKFAQFRDGEGRVPLIIGITGEVEALRSRETLAARVRAEPDSPRLVTDPEPLEVEWGEGYRIRVKVKRGEILSETRYYIARGRIILVLTFRDAIVPEDLREAIFTSLRWSDF